MTTQTETFLCARCGRTLPANALEQDTYTGFLSCKDDGACQRHIQDQGRAIEAQILGEIHLINSQREAKIKELLQVRHDYGLPDLALEHHTREMARIEGDDQC